MFSSATGAAVGGWALGAGVALLIGTTSASGGMNLVIIGFATVVGAGVGQIYGKQKGSVWGQDISNETNFGRDATDKLYDVFD